MRRSAHLFHKLERSSGHGPRHHLPDAPHQQQALPLPRPGVAVRHPGRTTASSCQTQITHGKPASHPPPSWPQQSSNSPRRQTTPRHVCRVYALATAQPNLR
jgi:hypothetical protein